MMEAAKHLMADAEEKLRESRAHDNLVKEEKEESMTNCKNREKVLEIAEKELARGKAEVQEVRVGKYLEQF
jgi:hypothetical protein